MNSRSSNYPVAYRSDVFVLRPANDSDEPRAAANGIKDSRRVGSIAS